MANSLDLGKVMGSRIHSVTGTPDPSLGLENDWALDTGSGAVWEKTAAGWEARGSFRGEKGETGPQGPAGPAGAAGQTPALSIDAGGHLIATFE